MILINLADTGPTPRRIRRILPRAKKSTWRDAGLFWHRRLRPKHFTRRGAREYHFEKRTKKYTSRKLRIWGHTRPLEFTGETRALTRQQDIRATGRGVKIVIHAPLLNFRPGGINLGEEMTAVSRDEEQTIARVMDRALARRLNRDQGRDRRPASSA